jgi:hypothetical protein
MKYYALFLIMLLCFIYPNLIKSNLNKNLFTNSNLNSYKNSQVLLSNQEIQEILKCFGDLNLEEGCVICRYITQKICKKKNLKNFFNNFL